MMSPENHYMIREMLNKYIAFNYPEIENIYLMSQDRRVLQASGLYGYRAGKDFRGTNGP